nr:MAG TPA: endonuclease [Caudoviricetes sp.]
MQRHLSRKKLGSNRRNKCRLKVSRLHRDIANKRSWYMHNLTTMLVNNYDVICIENLNASGMLQNHKLAGSVYDASFSMFRNQLEYKCRWYGKELIVIDRFYPSSKTCSRCGWKNKDLKLSDRTFVCKDCGLEIDRDLNAAINIQAVGVDAAIRTQSSRVASCVEASKME